MAVINVTIELFDYRSATKVYIVAGTPTASTGYNMISFVKGTDAVGSEKTLKVMPADFLLVWCDDNDDPPILGSGSSRIYEALSSDVNQRYSDALSVYKVKSDSDVAFTLR